MALSLVTQYDYEAFLRVGAILQRKIGEFAVVREEAQVFAERLGEAQVWRRGP